MFVVVFRSKDITIFIQCVFVYFSNDDVFFSNDITIFIRCVFVYFSDDDVNLNGL